MKIKLGSKVIDSITGFAGVATARTEYLNGCIRIGLQAPVGKDGKIPDTEWFDEQRLTTKSKAKRGGPGPVPPSRDCPKR